MHPVGRVCIHLVEESKLTDTGGKNAFIQGLHGDYIVIF